MSVVYLFFCFAYYLLKSEILTAVGYSLYFISESVTGVFVFFIVAIILLKLVGRYHHLSINLGCKTALRHIAYHKHRAASYSGVASLHVGYVRRRFEPSDNGILRHRQGIAYIFTLICAEGYLIADFIVHHELAAVDNALVFTLRQSAVNYVKRAVGVVLAGFIKRIHSCNFLFARIRIDKGVCVIAGIYVRSVKGLCERLYIVIVKAVG